jgi:hypothetical protein
MATLLHFLEYSTRGEIVGYIVLVIRPSRSNPLLHQNRQLHYVPTKGEIQRAACTGRCHISFATKESFPADQKMKSSTFMSGILSEGAA